MTCSMLSAIIARAAPPRYVRHSGLRSAANLAGCPVAGGSAGSRTATCVGTPQAAHIGSRLQRWLGKLNKCRPAQHKGVLRSRLVAQLTQMLQMIISITRFSGTSRAESSGRRAGMFAKVRITAERTGDGALLLRSADELGDYPVTVAHSVRTWADADPDHPLVAERGPDGAWRTVTYGAAVAAADAIRQA